MNKKREKGVDVKKARKIGKRCEVEVMSCYGDEMYACVNCNNACMYVMQIKQLCLML